ncbi:hypothetical protein HU200_058155 [Digitaria exilis]|uniref:DUF4220 domain-containing protein n=1 Tax=Digitaria exilis TaxID=1010633 RepID=A0A835ANA8_9POAL|nr:hypothetical protein HU200_058155 [Digitaria exilis]
MEVQHLSARNATVTSREWSASQVGFLVRVEVLVTLSCALLTALVFLGSSRRNSHSAAFRLVVWLVLMLSYPAVFYTIGLMQSGSFDNSLVVVWACFLFGCSDGIATCSVDGNDKQARIMLNQATQVGRERVLTADNWLISKYMVDEEQVSSFYDFDPKNMDGYKYVVTGEMKKDGRDADSAQGKLLDATDAYVVTVDKVWQCEGSLLSSKDSSSSKFKDLCLSFALFKLLRRRLNSSPLPELGDIRTAVFVRRGIAGGGDHERLFRVVEVELSFLYDFHYARYPSPKQTLIPETAMFVAQMALSLCTLFSSPLLHYSSNNNPAAGDNKTISTGLDIWLARLVIALFVILELFQYLSLVLSDWHKVKLLCRYVRRRSWHGHRAMEMLLWLVCRATLTTRYWSNTVGQYSLLHACLENERSWILRMPLRHEWVKRRLTEARTVTRRNLPTSVKQAIHQHLQSDWLCYSAMYGDRTLQRNILEYDFEWSTSSYRHGGMGNLLIWHIATAIRGAADAGGDAGGEGSYEAATTLSNYCGYLLFQAPELVTDAIYDERLLMEALHRRIQKHLRSNQCHSERDMFVKLSAFRPSGTNTSEEDDILADGVRLGSLIEAKLPDEKQRWKVLAEMWVELLLTVTPSHNVSAHVNRLATGGELITHLWALLTHAGMIERPTPCTLWAPYVYVGE